MKINVMNANEATENSTADKLFAYALVQKDRRNALYVIGDLLDSGELTQEKAQQFLEKLVPGANLAALPVEYKARWWQQKGWKGIMRRFGRKHK